MNRIDELKDFAKQKEDEAKAKLKEYRQDVDEKMSACIRVRERHPVIRCENESNNEDQDIQDFHSDLNGILEFYEVQLDRIGHFSKRIEECLPVDFENVKLEENKSEEYYKKIINDGYDNVLKMLIETGRAITSCCKLIVDTADENRLKKLNLLGKIYVPMSMVAKFLLPVQRISDVLNETLEQIEFRDTPPSNPNDSNQCDEARGKLKKLAKQLVIHDNEIKSSSCDLLEMIYDSYGFEPELKDIFASFLRKYYHLNAVYGIIHLDLCGYGSSEPTENPLPTKPSKQKEQIQDYLKEVNRLRAEVQDLVNSVVQEARKSVFCSLTNLTIH
ncbi:unnamed protein product [Caenorhabditis nigoni]